MGQRWRRGVAVLVLGAAAQAGCMTSRLEVDATVGKPTESKASKGETLPSPEAAQLCVNMAETFEKNGLLNEAIGQYESARQQNPKLKQVAHRLGILYDRTGDQHRALLEYQKAMAERPRDAALLNDIGYCHYNQGNWAEAEKHLRLAIESNPKHERAWVNLGMTLGQQGRYEESLEAFGKAVRPAEAQCNLAFILHTQGKRAEATQAYQAALELEPGLRLARLALAKLEEADKTIQQTGSKMTNDQ